MAVIIEENHPIPQQISSYQFKLVGEMTLKQFFQVAAGAIVSLIIYSSNLSIAIKWPLILASFLTGIAFAFFPIQDRPLSKWISLFVQAIYSPTVFLWKKGYIRPEFFAPEPSEGLQTQSLPQNTTVQVQTQPVNRQVSQGVQSEQVQNTSGTDQNQKVITDDSAFVNKVNRDIARKEDDLIKADYEGKGLRKTEPNLTGDGSRGQKVVVPKSNTIEVDRDEKQVFQADRSGFDNNTTDTPPSPQAATGLDKNAVNAQFAASAGPPEPPQIANIIVGQTVSSNGEIVDNAILEIKDSGGRPVRALKSNKLGHFMIVTPLPNDQYQITAEKEGYMFNSINITLEGKILEPVIIKAVDLPFKENNFGSQ